MGRKLYLTIFATVIALVAGLTYFVMNNADASTNSNPSSLIGDWHQTNGSETGTGFTAEISAGGIQINYPTRDGSGGIFWLGTFDGTKKSAGSFKVQSKPDPDGMANNLLASNEKIKTFSYKDGVISFDFSILKMHTTIHMTKNVTK